MKAWKAILGVALVFLLGIATGVMLTGKFVELRVRDAIGGGPEEIASLVERRLAQKLSLTPEQRERLRPAIEGAQSRIAAVRRESEPEIRRILEDTRTEIRSALSPEQAGTYDEMVAAAWAKRFPKPAHP